MIDNFFRDDASTREVADPCYSKETAFTACSAYGAVDLETQDKIQDYEAIPRENIPPLPPPRTSNPT